MAASGDGVEGGFSVPLTFFTTTFDQQMPETSFSVPLTTLPAGLNVLVNSVLEIDPPEEFDFLVNDEYVTTTLEKFLRKRGMNYEEIISVEYTPAMHAQESSKVPHDDWVSSIRAPFVGNKNLLVTGAYDQCVRVWNGDECLAIGAGHRGAVKSIAIHPSSIAGKTAGSDQVGKKRKTTSDVAKLQFASGGKDGRLMAWEFDPASDQIKPLGSIQQHVGSVDAVDVSSDGRLLCSASWDCTAKVFTWDDLVSAKANEQKKPVLSLTDHARPVLCSRFSPSRSQVVMTAGLDGNIKSWDVNNAKLLSTYKAEHSVNSISLLPSGTTHDLIVAGCTDNRVRLFDSRSAGCVRSMAGHRQWVYAVAWCWRAGDASHPGELFLSAGEDATVRVWDTRCTAAALTTLDKMHTDGVLDVTYVGNLEAASGGKDNKTKTFSLVRNGGK